MKKPRPDTATLAKYVGERLRFARESHLLRQDELASIGRAWGLDWTQATVAAIEAGRRRLTLEEFLLLPWVASGSGTGPAYALGGKSTAMQLSEFFVGDPDRPVRLSAAVTMKGRGLQEIVAGRAALDDASVEALTRARLAERDQWGDAERKAARRLGRTSLIVAGAARKRWGRSFTEERDARLAAQATSATPPRALQALRGHITRALIEELRAGGRIEWPKKGGRR